MRIKNPTGQDITALLSEMDGLHEVRMKQKYQKSYQKPLVEIIAGRTTPGGNGFPARRKPFPPIC